MLQNKFEMPLDLIIKPSSIFHTYYIVIFLFSIISVFILTALPLSLKLLLFLLLLFIGHTIKKQNFERIVFLNTNAIGEFEIETNYHECYEAKLTGECIVTYFLIWLNFSVNTIDGKKKIFHLLLLPDSADRDLLRQLRVRLRFLLKDNQDETSEYI